MYIRTDPEVCLERLRRRARSEEAGVPLSYLKSLHKHYEDWLVHRTLGADLDIPILILDGNQVGTCG